MVIPFGCAKDDFRTIDIGDFTSKAKTNMSVYVYNLYKSCNCPLQKTIRILLIIVICLQPLNKKAAPNKAMSLS